LLFGTAPRSGGGAILYPKNYETTKNNRLAFGSKRPERPDTPNGGSEKGTVKKAEK